MQSAKFQADIRNHGIIETIPGTDIYISWIVFILIYIIREGTTHNRVVSFCLHAVDTGEMQGIVGTDRESATRMYGGTGIEQELTTLETFLGPVDMVYKDNFESTL